MLIVQIAPFGLVLPVPASRSMIYAVCKQHMIVCKVDCSCFLGKLVTLDCFGRRLALEDTARG